MHLRLVLKLFRKAEVNQGNVWTGNFASIGVFKKEIRHFDVIVEETALV